MREGAIRLAKGETLSPPPVEAMLRAADVFGGLAVGKVDPLIDEARKIGQHAPVPSEARAIGIAVAYKMACEEPGIEHNGLRIKINDPASTKTVAIAYHVNEATVRKWVRNHEPAFLGIGYINASALTDKMKRAGMRYQYSGRSNAAIKRRNAKGRNAGPRIQ